MKSNMNLSVKATGRLVKDVKVNTTQSGKQVATIRLAIENNYRNKDGEFEAKYYNVTLWNYAAKKAEKYHQGDLVEITGTLDNRQKDGKDNNEIVGEDITLRSKNKSYNQTLEQEEEMER